MNKIFRNGGTDDRFHADGPFHAVNPFYLFHHLCFFLLIHLVILQHDHIDVIHVEIFVQLLIGHRAFQRIREPFVDIVVYIRAGIAIDGRNKQDQERCQPYFIVPRDECGQLPKVRQYRLVRRLVDPLVECEHHGLAEE